MRRAIWYSIRARCYSTASSTVSTSKNALKTPPPSKTAKLTCGLEIHAQLMTRHKLFSNSRTSFQAAPNSQVSFYDAALPGTQPVFNLEALRLALTAAVSLDCTVQPKFSFDRKHYFYGDQPAGYQITQHYEPFAVDGKLVLYERDGLNPKVQPKDIPVRIKQIQIEQDTGKTTYVDNQTASIDLNRTNTALIELVTEPDIPDPESAGVFVRKLQALLRHLGVCSGELETGAMRVDVNVSIDGGERCEIKNLFSTSAVVHAIKAEYKRQVRDVAKGIVITSETRGWDGKNTYKLRGKESTVDYRYMPDPELLPVLVKPEIVAKLKQSLPLLPDQLLLELLKEPYSVPLVDARTIMNTPHMREYFLEVYDQVKQANVSTKSVSNWICHRLLGELEGDFSGSNPVEAQKLAHLITMVEQNKLTKMSGTLILKHLVTNPADSVDALVEQFDLAKVETQSEDAQDAVRQLCESVISENPRVVEGIKKGKAGPIKFLVGQVMRQTQGRLDAQAVESILRSLL